MRHDVTATMTDLEAAWVRDHAWTKAMRKTFAQAPGFYLVCGCQSGPCHYCQHGNHRECVHRRNQPLVEDECVITNGRERVLYLPEQFKHPHRTATGWHRTKAAMVWLADRRCVWSCPCDCRAGEPIQPPPIVLVPTRQLRRNEPAGQEALFGVMSS